MKRLSVVFLLVLVAGCTQFSFAQKNAGNNLSEHYKKVFQQSLAYNDLSVATEAVHGILASDPEATNWLDTLATLYFQRGAFPQCLLTSNDILKDNPENTNALEMRAISKENLGLLKEALADYEVLYGKTKNIYHLYQISTIQFGLRRFGECEQTVNAMLADERGKEETILITIDRGQQRVPFYAACHNLLGVLQLDMGKKDVAKKHFETALQIYPEFALAKANMEAMNKQ